MTPRPNKHEYLMWLAVVASSRGTCNRRRVGCVIATADGHIVSTGYNGSPPGAPHCDDDGHLMHDGHCVRTIHAEANAVSHAARMGLPLAGCSAYVTTKPCPSCMMLLAASGVKTVVHLEPYHTEEDQVTIRLASMAGLEVINYSGELTWCERPWERGIKR